MPLAAKFVHQLALTLQNIGGCPRRRFHGHLLEELLVRVAQLIPHVRSHLRSHPIHDVRGEHDVFLDLVELLGEHGRERVFLCVHRAVLQRQIHLGEGDSAWGLPRRRAA